MGRYANFAETSRRPCAITTCLPWLLSAVFLQAKFAASAYILRSAESGQVWRGLLHSGMDRQVLVCSDFPPTAELRLPAIDRSCERPRFSLAG